MFLDLVLTYFSIMNNAGKFKDISSTRRKKLSGIPKEKTKATETIVDNN